MKIRHLSRTAERMIVGMCENEKFLFFVYHSWFAPTFASYISLPHCTQRVDPTVGASST